LKKLNEISEKLHSTSASLKSSGATFATISEKCRLTEELSTKIVTLTSFITDQMNNSSLTEEQRTSLATSLENQSAILVEEFHQKIQLINIEEENNRIR